MENSMKYLILFFVAYSLKFHLAFEMKIKPIIWKNVTYSSEINFMYNTTSRRLICINQCWNDLNCFYVVIKFSKKFDMCHFYSYNLNSMENFSNFSNSFIYLKRPFLHQSTQTLNELFELERPVSLAKSDANNTRFNLANGTTIAGGIVFHSRISLNENYIDMLTYNEKDGWNNVEKYFNLNLISFIDYEFIVAINDNYFTIFINNQALANYTHRYPFNQIKYVFVDKDSTNSLILKIFFKDLVFLHKDTV
ncbi:hypothetical protein BpHYR1_006514 [Brachionus plicatilis]|uniref:Galectin n=1 Tax=Brachionus plicatilis TaxID=10195 RepID=A0A3M7R7Z6_BRAPC|nr:hypothetical protein BpHYR1_006514 [Brachionus plicatilis]